MKSLSRISVPLLLTAAVLSASGPVGADDAPTIRTVAGTVPNGVAATSVSLTGSALDFDTQGNLFIADPGQGMVWRLDPHGQIHHVAGTGRTCAPDAAVCANEGGLAREAFLHIPSGIAVAPSGDVYVSEQQGFVVRRIDADTGRIHTVAGDGEIWYDASKEGGPATRFPVGLPGSLDFDSEGNLYIADVLQGRIYRLTPGGTITTFAGCGDQNPALGCDLHARDGSPVESTPIGPNAYVNGAGFGIAIDDRDRMFIADAAQILRLDTETKAYRVIAGRTFDYATTPGQGAGGPASEARFGIILEMDFAPNGDLVLLDGGRSLANPWNRVMTIDAPVTPASTIRHVGGTGMGNDYGGDGGPATEARFAFDKPVNTYAGQGLSVASNGDILVADYGNSRIRRIDAETNEVTTVAGNGNGGPGDYLHGIVGDLQPYVWDGMDRYLYPTGGLSGDGGQASAAQLHGPVDVEVAPDGSLYVLDRHSYRVRRIAPDGTIVTVAGSGCAGQWCYMEQRARAPGDGGPATAAPLVSPTSIELDASGTQLYVLDAESQRIRQVNLGDSSVTVYPASPTPITIDPGEIATVLGPGTNRSIPDDPLTNDYVGCALLRPYCGEGLPHDRYSLSDFASGLALDGAGNLYFSDTHTNQVLRIDAATGLVLGVVGAEHASDCEGQTDEHAVPGRLARLCGPTSLAFDGTTLYIAESSDVGDIESLALGSGFTASRVRAVDLSTPAAITTIFAGTGEVGLSGDGGAATSAKLAQPHGLAVGADGSLYIADTGNSRIRRVAPDGTIQTVAGTGAWSSTKYDVSGCGFGGDGGAASAASLCAPIGLAMTPGGDLYVADQLNNRIRVIEGL